MHESKIDAAETRRENRQLRAALDDLLTQLEGCPGVDVDCGCVREQMPASPGEKNPIEPPWERNGYDSKQAWQEDKKDGG